MLAYKPSSMGLNTPASGAIFTWDAIPGVSGLGITVESYTDEALKRQQVAEHIQVKMADDMKVIGANLGYFFKDRECVGNAGLAGCAKSSHIPKRDFAPR